MSTGKTDLAAFGNIPRTLFEEFSQKYGNGAEGEVRIAGVFIRPITKPETEGSSEPYAGLALHEDEGKRYCRLEVLAYMPENESEFSMDFALHAARLLTTRIGIKQVQKTPPRYQIFADVKISSQGLDMLSSNRLRLSLIYEILARFGELTDGYQYEVCVEAEAA